MKRKDELKHKYKEKFNLLHKNTNKLTKNQTKIINGKDIYKKDKEENNKEKVADDSLI